MKLFGATIILTLTLISGLQAQEYKYHPLFIYNFSKYIEWPTSQTQGDFVVCIVGNEQAYQQMVNFSQKKRKIKNQNLVIRKCNTLREIGKSNIVFVTKSAKVSLREIEDKLDQSATLLITEQQGMGRQGAHINFIAMADSKIGFELNTTSTQNAGLKVANSLAMLAAETY